MVDEQVVIIGAGMSGLAAGIRLAHFGKHVLIVEKHRIPGGLNSYYWRNGRRMDVGLHAVTNYVPVGRKQAPLPKLLSQLRLAREELDLCPQRWSEIRFPGCTLRFSNDIELLFSDVRDRFPGQVDRLRRLTQHVEAFDDKRLDVEPGSARQVLREYLSEPLLAEMILCPVMYYGCAREHDMEFVHFATTYKSIFCEGLARPRDGVQRFIGALVKRYKAAGGQLRLGDGVARLDVHGGRVRGVRLESGEELPCDLVFSCAGYYETMRLCSDVKEPPAAADLGRLSVIEAISILDRPPADFGLDAAVVFFNDAEQFPYACPSGPVETGSGVICCPNNFERHEDLPEGVIRSTALARYEDWAGLGDEEYARAKREWCERLSTRVESFAPGFREHVLDSDLFTPRTIHRFTGRLNGALYGAPQKLRDGRTRLDNLFICGTDQGLVGIVGALLSGIWMANLHVLARS
ncbi:MAG TPA: NAD(P)/FAD-dependent oxidoreductase [Phycisphaerae bacterium]|nr:NAD(P)/FAD-dependent oxidoreductase [Phycisphaerae bacterium]HNU45976.1 NAD(P)/FAD-dependent oxidoreductase [Phycisphaerae bacterium]